jgi:glycosyltransferase involved in cell wall biosynthesis
MKNLNAKISVIVPAFNEEEIIEASLREIVRTFDEFGCDYEVVLMDDGSNDSTLKKGLKMAEKFPRIKVKRNMENFGKGRAIKKAFRYCDGQYIVFLDADLDLHPGQAQTLFDIMRLDEADVVIGSKMHPNSQVNYPYHRRFISLIYYWIIKVMFDLPVHDTQTGLKLFKREVLEKVFPRMLVKKFAFDLEILAIAKHFGYKFAEAPIVLTPQRPYGRIGLKAMAKTGWDTLAVFYRMRIMKYYDRPVSGETERG